MKKDERGITVAELLVWIGAVAVAAGVGIALLMEWRGTAMLDAEVERVRGVALAYANHRCGSLPAGAVTLDNALAELGRKESVRDAGDWSILLSPVTAGTVSQSGTSVSAAVRYRTGPDTRASRHLMLRSGARRSGAFVEVPAHRTSIDPSKSSFQFLWTWDVAGGGAC